MIVKLLLRASHDNKHIFVTEINQVVSRAIKYIFTTSHNDVTSIVC